MSDYIFKVFVTHVDGKFVQSGEDFPDYYAALNHVCERRPKITTSTWSIRRIGNELLNHEVVTTFDPSNNPRDIELPIGDNKFVIQRKVDKHHVSESYLSVAKAIRHSAGKNWRIWPRQIRRGIIRCVIDTHKANKACFVQVTRGF